MGKRGGREEERKEGSKGNLYSQTSYTGVRFQERYYGRYRAQAAAQMNIPQFQL